MNEHESYLWVERYKPRTVDECILPQRIKNTLNEFVESGEIKNYIASGSAGCGKTSSAKALLNQMNIQYLFINASNDGNIDTIRTKVTRFASTKSILSSYKVVVLDECLHEDEQVRIGSVDNWKPVALKDLNKNTTYPVVSFNMETGVFENDTGYIISDKEDELYEVELEDGSLITLNEKHPFIVKDIDGKFIEKTLESLKVGDIIVKML